MSISSDSDVDMALLLDSDDSSDSSTSSDSVERQCLRADYTSTLNRSDFRIRFRLDKEMIEPLLNEIRPFLRVKSSRNHGVSELHQLLLALRFYAVGTMLLPIADFIGVSKSSASRIVKDVSYAIAELYPKYIKMTENAEVDFYSIASFPRVAGAIDCHHIKIQSPNSNIGEEFRNSKGYFSLNVQGVCDANLRFLNVVARWPGSTHDATIFNNSTLRAQCENGLLRNNWLLGDSAYPLKPYLLTPLLNPLTDSDRRYNEAHMLTRFTIERCFGVWIRRFPVIGLYIRLSQPTVQAVIIATAVLHNICRDSGIEETPTEVEIPNYRPVDLQHEDDLRNNTERHQLIQDYFNRLE